MDASSTRRTGRTCAASAFADDQIGWVGTLAEERRLIDTTDGGATWNAVEDLPAEAPPAICGLCVVDAQVVYGSGTNIPDQPTGVVKTVDGGATWTAIDMRAHATMLSTSCSRCSTWLGRRRQGRRPNPAREDVIPVVLSTEDGGATWTNRRPASRPSCRKASGAGRSSSSDDSRLRLARELDRRRDPQDRRRWCHVERKVGLRSAGQREPRGHRFPHRQLGGPAAGGTELRRRLHSETRDGGETWTDANHVGRFINRFRFIREPELVGYASGDTVYSTRRWRPELALGGRGARRAAPIKAACRCGCRSSDRAPGPRVDMWDRFGRHVASRRRAAEARRSGRARRTPARRAPPGIYIVRLTGEDWSESRTVASRVSAVARELTWTDYELSVPGGRPLRPPRWKGSRTGPETVTIQIPGSSGFPAPQDKARILLESAAEIEHALMVQYLYAAYSLKGPDAVAEADSRARWTPSPSRAAILFASRARRWDTSDGAAPADRVGLPTNLEREDFPPRKDLYPFPLHLERLTQRSLAKYVVAEAPAAAEGIDDVVEASQAAAGAAVNRVGMIYGLLGLVFSGAAPAPAVTDWDQLVQHLAEAAYRQSRR